MIPRKLRLPANISFRNSSVTESYFFTLRHKANTCGHNRYSVVVSKKIDKRAVGRNKIKRMFRSCIQKLDGETRQGYDMLYVIKRPYSQEEETKNLCILLQEILQKQQLLA